MKFIRNDLKLGRDFIKFIRVLIKFIRNVDCKFIKGGFLTSLIYLKRKDLHWLMKYFSSSFSLFFELASASLSITHCLYFDVFLYSHFIGLVKLYYC